MNSCCCHQRKDAVSQLAKTWCIPNSPLRHWHGLYLSCIVFICFQRSILLVKACVDSLVVATRICISSLLLVSVPFSYYTSFASLCSALEIILGSVSLVSDEYFSW